MNLAKISANDQITVSVEIRRLLGLKSGDKILFCQNKNGEIIVSNASAAAIYRAQAAFSGAADAMGVADEDDIQKLIDECAMGESSAMRILINTNILFSALLFPSAII